MAYILNFLASTWNVLIYIIRKFWKIILVIGVFLIGFMALSKEKRKA